MAHGVKFSLPRLKRSQLELGRPKIEFVIAKDGKTFGTLYVSKGGLFWRRKRKSRTKRLRWEQFDKLMDDR